MKDELDSELHHLESHKTLLDKLKNQMMRNCDKITNLENRDFRRLEYLLDSLKCV